VDKGKRIQKYFLYTEKNIKRNSCVPGGIVSRIIGRLYNACGADDLAPVWYRPEHLPRVRRRRHPRLLPLTKNKRKIEPREMKRRRAPAAAVL